MIEAIRKVSDKVRRMALFTFHLSLFTLASASSAQGFVNLTAKEVRVAQDLPYYTASLPLPVGYGDSIYTVSIEYPEYINMQRVDQELLREQGMDVLPETPDIHSYVSVERGRGTLDVSFLPFVQKDGKAMKLVSFKLALHSQPAHNSLGKARAARSEDSATGGATTSAADRYADHSVLSTGRWAKIRVSENGPCELTSDVIKKAGFTDLSRVAVYGYGGHVQPLVLRGDYLQATDDLMPVQLYEQDGRRFFYANGTVSYDTPWSKTRNRNQYSQYAYYFITQQSEPVTALSADEYVSGNYPANHDYHSLYEQDGYAWYEGGSNLYDPTELLSGRQQTITLDAPEGVETGSLTVSISAANQCSVTVTVNGVKAAQFNSNRRGTYDHASIGTNTFNLINLQPQNTITISTTAEKAHLDYCLLTFEQPKPAPVLTRDAVAAEYVYNITNQDHHGDAEVDMVIIVPTSAKLTEQAKRIKDLHEKQDGMTVQIVPADELFNEFSSGTPDANAYRRYLKMMYDRSDCQKPTHLLLFGDAVWDNRMLIPALRKSSPDDYLLCYESENSISSTECYVDDGWFCLLDDGEGDKPKENKPDVAVGRFPVTTVNSAKTIVDKVITVATNANAGSWQSRVVLLGDDGLDTDSSPFVHIKQAESIGQNIEKNFPGLYVKRYYWNAYQRQSSASGNRYPALETAVKQEMKDGALIFNYVGHGRADAMSHEYVLTVGDFNVNSRHRTSIWVTASCDIMPFDGLMATIGETAILNENGCAHTFFGTTRTVYSGYNEKINKRFMNYVIQTASDGRMLHTIGESVRRTKVDLVELREDLQANKLQYTLLGDPALRLAIPADSICIDYINDIRTDGTEMPQFKAGGLCTIKGRIIRRATGETMTDFNGTIETSVRDCKQTVICRDQNSGTGEQWTYEERPVTLYSGNDAVANGEFSIQFRLPAEVSYSNLQGMIQQFAINEARTVTALGSSDHVIIGGSDLGENDGIGPSIYCYLNEPDFQNGGDVNTTPYFFATINDKDGLNVSASGLGHEMLLTIDNNPGKSYALNDYFTMDFGSYTSGTIGFSLPALEPGRHQLKFRCFDVFNNSNTVQLDFNVVDGLTPRLNWVSCLQNPAKTQTTFLISHNRAGSELDLTLQVFDMAGRKVYEHTTTDVPESANSTLTWNLTNNDGANLPTGVYLYRIIAGDKDNIKESKAEKIIIMR